MVLDKKKKMWNVYDNNDDNDDNDGQIVIRKAHLNLRLRWAKKIVTMSFCYPDRPAQKIPAGPVPWDWTGCPRIPRNAAGSPCSPAPPGTSPGSPDTSGRRGVPTRSVRRTIRPRMYRYSGSHAENSSLTTEIRSLAACQTVLQNDNSYVYLFERHENCFFFFFHWMNLGACS